MSRGVFVIIVGDRGELGLCSDVVEAERGMFFHRACIGMHRSGREMGDKVVVEVAARGREAT